MSSPYALPVGPTRRAESRTSSPPPEPRSSTNSPGRRSARAVGLPQPSDAASASAGSAAVSPHPYRFEVTGSAAPREDAVLHPVVPPAVTRSAARPYLSFTLALMSSL